MVDPYYINPAAHLHQHCDTIPTSTQMKAYVYDDLPSVPTLTLAIPG